MDTFVTGASGYIGRAFVRAGAKPLRCDVSEYNDVDRAVSVAKPNLVIHLAGMSDPDTCELHADSSYRINIRGTYNVMEVCAKNGIPAVLLSSAQIWGGGWWESLWNRHTESSPFTPARNRYGMQKSAAEFTTSTFNSDGYHLAKIVRTSFVFDRLRFQAELSDLESGKTLDAPTFLKRSFIHLSDFVDLFSHYCARFDTMPAILHLAGSKTVSYCDFWLEVCKQFGYNPKLIRCRRVEKNYPQRAKRPRNAGLDVSLSLKLGFKSYDYVGGIERMKNES